MPRQPSAAIWTLRADRLEALYAQYNQLRYIHPDPLEVLAEYPDIRDREIAGLIAAALAFGNVQSILRSVRTVLDAMGSPRRFLETSDARQLRKTFHGFRHRYVTGREVSGLLLGARCCIEEFDSLEAAFLSGLPPHNSTVHDALSRFAALLRGRDASNVNYLLPDPAKGSACKRFHLYLRWMVRKDNVDPGGWTHVSPATLIVPVDTHMHRMALALGLTRRNQPNLATALEITAAFRKIAPDDPVRYDFALTRLGIRRDTDWPAFVTEWPSRRTVSMHT